VTYHCATGKHAECDDWQTDSYACSCHCHLSRSAQEHARECDIPTCKEKP